jgi:hypothetical protein
MKIKMNELIIKIKRGLKKPPRVILRRLKDEFSKFLGQYFIPYRARFFSKEVLLKETKSSEINQLWEMLFFGRYPIHLLSQFSLTNSNYKFELDKELILFQAEKAYNKEVNLLGTGWIYLGEHIDWHRDYKSNVRWKPKYFSKISYVNPNDKSDVKIPWEISRLQWLIPVGQAYILTKDEKYAKFVKEIVLSWIESNPYGQSVNWSCTMEVAMRIFTFTWLFKVFGESVEWQYENFKFLYLKNLFLHGEFTEKFIERSDINGNHYTADAAGMVFCGLFFERGVKPEKWVKSGWEYLLDEIKKQVFEDGVNYEGSIPYHRLVTELFYYPAYYRKLHNLDVEDFYIERLNSMAMFSATYSRIDGSTPLWGDADDARVFPFRTGALNDHRYLIGLIGIGFNNDKLLNYFTGNIQEIYWNFGEDCLRKFKRNVKDIASTAFKQGGFYILRDQKNHIFIDCGPLGLAGRGGHGHNDLLAFEGVLDKELLFTDCGQYLYTADFSERNQFRSTSYHNTPQINEEEINRFIRWDYLWNLHNDAGFFAENWEVCSEYSQVLCHHNGYMRLANQTSIKRSFKLFHKISKLKILDSFSTKGNGFNKISIPFHLSDSVIIKQVEPFILLESNGKLFSLKYSSEANWTVHRQNCRISKSYGTFVNSEKIIFMAELNTGSIEFVITKEK